MVGRSHPDQQQEWLDASTAWLVEEYGRENIAHLRLHGDERTPHLTGFIVPLDPENGHLNARRWVGGARRCAQQQTDYAASVEALGLSRGVEGSTAEHESVKRHYGQIAQPIAKLSIARPPRVLMDPEGWAAEQRQSLAKQAGPTLPAPAPQRATERPARPPRRRQRRHRAALTACKPPWTSRKPFRPVCAPCPSPMCWTPLGSRLTPRKGPLEGRGLQHHHW